MFTESNGFLVLSSLFYFKNPKRHLFVNIDLIAAAMLDSPPLTMCIQTHTGGPNGKTSRQGEPVENSKDIFSS